MASIMKHASFSEADPDFPVTFISMRQSSTRSRSVDELTPSVRGKMTRRFGSMGVYVVRSVPQKVAMVFVYEVFRDEPGTLHDFSDVLHGFENFFSLGKI